MEDRYIGMHELPSIRDSNDLMAALNSGAANLEPDDPVAAYIIGRSYTLGLIDHLPDSWGGDEVPFPQVAQGFNTAEIRNKTGQWGGSTAEHGTPGISPGRTGVPLVGHPQVASPVGRTSLSTPTASPVAPKAAPSYGTPLPNPPNAHPSHGASKVPATHKAAAKRTTPRRSVASHGLRGRHTVATPRATIPKKAKGTTSHHTTKRAASTQKSKTGLRSHAGHTHVGISHPHKVSSKIKLPAGPKSKSRGQLSKALRYKQEPSIRYHGMVRVKTGKSKR